MPNNHLATVTFEHGNGMPEDRIVNTFAIKDLTVPDPSSFQAICDALYAFYNEVPTGGVDTIAKYLSPVVSRVVGGMGVRIYSLDGVDTQGRLKLRNGSHGSPVHEDLGMMLNAAIVGSDALPGEVAYCLTLEATDRAGAAVEVADGADPDAKVDRPKQRHTGRIYLGPLGDETLSLVGGISRPRIAFRQVVRQAAEDLDIALEAITDNSGGWSVWSRQDALLRRLVAISDDDAWDTQRRRGDGPTARVRTFIG